MRLLNSIDRKLARLEGFFLSVLLLVMILLAFLQVVARNIFSTGLPWADAVVRLLLLWVGMLGAMLATQLGQHLSIDVFTKFFRGRSKRAVSLFIKLFASLVCLYLLRASIDFVKGEKGVGSEFFDSIPYWTVELILPIAFFFMVFHFTVSLLNDLKGLFSGEAS